jgi:deoxyadenosine/deoxycytidine kinase
LFAFFAIDFSSISFLFFLKKKIGNIASGKSTILSYLSSSNNPNVFCMQEQVDDWMKMKNSGVDLLRLFYEKPSEYSFAFENLVQLGRMKAHYECFDYLESATSPCLSVFMERSIFSSYYVFLNNSLEEKRISQPEYQILTRYYQVLTSQLIKKSSTLDPKDIEKFMSMGKELKAADKIPLKIIYLKSSPDVCMSRLVSRHRSSENSVDLSYLIKINEKYERWIERLSKENGLVEVIDANVDSKNVLEQIKKIIY